MKGIFDIMMNGPDLRVRMRRLSAVVSLAGSVALMNAVVLASLFPSSSCLSPEMCLAGSGSLCMLLGARLRAMSVRRLYDAEGDRSERTAGEAS